MIRPYIPQDINEVFNIINDSAMAYKGVIPSDCWHEPYMSKDRLIFEINDGVRFFVWEDLENIQGVMGIQNVKGVTLIRHAYVRTACRNKGIGSELIKYLLSVTNKPVLIGTWASAAWAISFYKKHGFKVVSKNDIPMLLKKYWKISDRQIETSIVLQQSVKENRKNPR